MKTVSKFLLAIGFVAAGSLPAMANVVWTLNDVTFSNGDTASGTFTTNDAINQYLSFNISVTGPATAADFVATQMTAANLPNTIGAGSAGFAQYFSLTLASPLTVAGGVVAISGGSSCPGCGTLVTVGHSPEVTGLFVAPEPSTAALFLAAGMMLVPFLKRKA